MVKIINYPFYAITEFTKEKKLITILMLFIH